MTGGAPLLVTGATGQVGGAVMRLAARNGIAAIGPGRSQLDLEQPDQVANFVRNGSWAGIISCAAYTAVDKAEADASRAHAINAVAPGILAKAAATAAIPIVHVSTDYVFSGDAAGWYTETDPIAPLGVYGRTKADGETAVRDACPTRHSIVRTAWVQSAGGANFVRTMLRLGQERDELGVVADQIGCPTSAEDLAAVLLAMASMDRAHGQTWHAVNAGETSWHGLAEYIFAGAARRGLQTPIVRAIATADYPTPARRPANGRLSTAKLVLELGLHMRPWQAAIDDILARLLDQQPSDSTDQTRN